MKLRPWLALFLMVVCWQGIPGTLVRAEDPAADGAEYVDDQDVLRKLTAGLQALLEAGKTTPMATLVDQLKRKGPGVSLPSATEADSSLPDVMARRRSGVLVLGVLYRCDRCTHWHTGASSAFVVTASGVIVTSYHAVDDPSRETVGAMTADGQVYPVREILAGDPDADVAVLQLEGSGFTPISLGEPVRVGADVAVISHPDKRFYVLTSGVVSRYCRLRDGGKDVARMAITADFARGSSGAPVLTHSGEVVGMVASTHSVYYEHEDGHSQNLQMVVKYCIPVASIRKVLTAEPEKE